MKINLDEVEKDSGILPEDEYVVRVADASETRSKKKEDGSGDNPMIVVDFIVSAGDYKGAEIREWYTLNHNLGLRNLVALVQSLGLAPDGREFDTDQIPDEIIGKRCRVVTFNKPLGDRVNPRVSEYKPLQPTDPDDPLAVSPNGVTTPDEDVPF